MPHDKVNEDTAKCPMSLDEVDLFEPGAQNFWYDSYKILHKESPVHKIPGEGTSPDTDGFILSKYEDIAFIVKDILRFPPPVMKNTDLEKAGVSGFNAEKEGMDEEKLPFEEIYEAYSGFIRNPEDPDSEPFGPTGSVSDTTPTVTGTYAISV